MSGVVTITFVESDSAAKALRILNGVEVDRRPMKVQHELIQPLASTT